MERPGLLEIGVYVLVLAGAASWVYGLPPFDYEPGSARYGEVSPLASTTASEPAQSEDESEAAGERPSPQSSEPASQDSSPNVARDTSQPIANQDIASQPDEQQPDEQPRLDRQSNLLMVTATRLNMRSEPNANSALVGSYSRGALVEELSTSGNWVLVRTVEDESTGWMYAGFLGNVTDN
jgi:hypothetical protein